MWNLISFAIFWSVWLERNARMFEKTYATKEAVVQMVLMRIAK